MDRADEHCPPRLRPARQEVIMRKVCVHHVQTLGAQCPQIPPDSPRGRLHGQLQSPGIQQPQGFEPRHGGLFRAHLRAPAVHRHRHLMPRLPLRLGQQGHVLRGPTPERACQQVQDLHGLPSARQQRVVEGLKRMGLVLDTALALRVLGRIPPDGLCPLGLTHQHVEQLSHPLHIPRLEEETRPAMLDEGVQILQPARHHTAPRGHRLDVHHRIPLRVRGVDQDAQALVPGVHHLLFSWQYQAVSEPLAQRSHPLLILPLGQPHERRRPLGMLGQQGPDGLHEVTLALRRADPPHHPHAVTPSQPQLAPGLIAIRRGPEPSQVDPVVNDGRGQRDRLHPFARERHHRVRVPRQPAGIGTGLLRGVPGEDQLHPSAQQPQHQAHQHLVVAVRMPHQGLSPQSSPKLAPADSRQGGLQVRSDGSRLRPPRQFPDHRLHMSRDSRVPSVEVGMNHQGHGLTPACPSGEWALGPGASPCAPRCAGWRRRSGLPSPVPVSPAPRASLAVTTTPTPGGRAPPHPEPGCPPVPPAPARCPGSCPCADHRAPACPVPPAPGCSARPGS
ncbi:hypothetical protein STIAU_5464 [Stigmatella aurantiaca DW4/3-1]|uniref:Uncharacterized protein n=1 Tax=Stigmatella aurantiaca (strain DW4/3-1) TaxID=378806 RepID=Q08WN9_STIAD|nr:hypothetical protein STIAU_5464 [Stigmatella aurantiaca DW4/3-1]